MTMSPAVVVPPPEVRDSPTYSGKQPFTRLPRIPGINISCSYVLCTIYKCILARDHQLGVFAFKALTPLCFAIEEALKKRGF